MKRAYLSMLLAVVLPAISVYAQGARGGGSRGSAGGHAASVSHGYSGPGRTGFHSGFSGRPAFHGFRGGYHGYYGRGYGRGYYYRRGYGGLVIGYGYGSPYCYPYYGSPYYCAPAYGYSAVPPDDTYDTDYVSGPMPDTAVVDSSQTAGYTAQDAQGYYQVGNQWGVEFKQYQVTMNQLVTYLKAYIINSSPAQQDAFRSGFIASALPNATVMFDQAMQQAIPRS
jgi:hypothetical protein